MARNLATIEGARAKLLGLTGSAPAADGGKIHPGDEVILTGKVLRVHASGFLILSVEGASPQPALIVHSTNVERRSE